MGLVYIEHPELNKQKTRLSADVAAAATSSTVENNDNFAANDYCVFGKPGEELTEIVKLTSVTGNTTLGHTTGPVFAHSARTPISQIKYNQVKVYSASSETGTYSLLTTIDLDIDEEQTVYDDTTGTSTTWYKVKYYNETTTALSDYSAAVQATGYTDQSLYSMQTEVLEDYGDPNADEITRDRLRTYLRAGVRRLSVDLIKQYPTFLRTYTTQALTDDTEEYDYPDYFLGFYMVSVNFSGSSASDAYKIEKFEAEEAIDNPGQTYSKGDPRIFLRNTSYIIKPTPDSSSGYAFLWYWSYPTPMTDPDDTHGLPHGAREPLIAYALYRLWLTKGKANADTALMYKREWEDSRDDWIEFVGQARSVHAPRMVRVTSGQDLYSV